MYWLRKFYGPTICFAPANDQGREIEEADEDLNEESEETDEESDEESGETDEESDEESEETDEESEDSVGEQSSNRRESRNARQARENRELREKLARLEGENGALKTAPKPADNAEARRQREEKLALMSPEEKMTFESNEKVSRLEHESRTTQLLLLDMQDKNSYDLMCTQDPVAAKYKGEVEELLAAMRKNNTTAPRETLLNYVIGKHAREGLKKPEGKKKMKKLREDADNRVKQSKSKPMSARGDTGGSSKGGDDSTDSLRQRILDRERRGDMN